MKVKKLNLKLLDEDSGKVKWFHLCYISEELYNTFCEKFDVDAVSFSDYVSDWMKLDFNMNLTMTTRKDLCIMKEVVKNKYMELYPTIYYNTKIDTHGWVRVWISQKMEAELKNV